MVDKTIDNPQPAEVSSRSIRVPDQCVLWARAAGRCQFLGCNRPLWKSPVTQEPVNIAEKAHIYAFSPAGARSNDDIESAELNRAGNLMLVCHDCHRKMDKAPDGGRYTVELLRSWKHQHEARIELVTGISPEMSSRIVLYGANIGEYGSPLMYESTSSALFPDRHPASDQPIGLGSVDGMTRDHTPEFWDEEARNLERRFESRVRQPMARGALGHLSVFALAPQPLLIRLGTLLTDLVEVDVYQRHREPPTWRWLDDPPAEGIRVEEPELKDGTPALAIALSATVSDDRITTSLDRPTSIWRITVDQPHNDWLRGRRQLEAFRQTARALMDRIKAVHGEHAVLHVFPAAPVAVAVELGRIRQPKADLAWVIYDQHNKLGGFAPALNIRKDSSA
jgi:hypothetical protein